ncbi:MAG: tRNA (adenosine(37)-N6)-threonylcarbamoyltransferase complex ATPase subunit type 1 TsaE [Solobacterium sp.]|nr:tRNA (adenosine(37)-N6)-threonylcarbamoyltransferase complex ATPase subunit type 1 TsaE [Solobacterium sp.]
MKTLTVTTHNTAETHAFGAKLGASASGGMVFLLSGDLGAGKTTLTQGIAKGLGITRVVTSPTFTIQKLYRGGRLVLNHIDAYRLEGISQDLGFDEYMYDEGLTVIEWPQFAPDLIPEEYLSISIRLLEEENRRFELEAHGPSYEALLEEIA